jgi:hypothetical protein
MRVPVRVRVRDPKQRVRNGERVAHSMFSHVRENVSSQLAAQSPLSFKNIILDFGLGSNYNRLQ